jgi:hypothetical protein
MVGHIHHWFRRLGFRLELRLAPGFRSRFGFRLRLTPRFGLRLRLIEIFKKLS